jgi:hypothetical protein
MLVLITSPAPPPPPHAEAISSSCKGFFAGNGVSALTKIWNWHFNISPVQSITTRILTPVQMTAVAVIPNRRLKADISGSFTVEPCPVCRPKAPGSGYMSGGKEWQKHKRP